MARNTDLPSVSKLAIDIESKDTTIADLKARLSVLNNETWSLTQALRDTEKERAVLAHMMVAKLDILPRDTMQSPKNGKMILKPITEPMTDEQIQKVGEEIDRAADAVKGSTE